MKRQEKLKAIRKGVELMSDNELLNAIDSDLLPIYYEYIRRIQSRERKIDKVTRSLDAVDILRPHYLGSEVEQFNVIYMNRANMVICVRNIGKGGLTACIADVRIILKQAIEVGASALILSHNHPSGNLRPSEQDNRITKTISEGAKLLDIVVMDHVILTETGYFSYSDEGLL